MATKAFQFNTVNGVDFQNLFQSRIRPVGVQEFTLEELQEANRNVGFFQAEVDDAKVDALVKSLIQDGTLFRPLEVLYVKGQPEILYLGGGRHRLASIVKLMQDYSLNAKGQVVEDYLDESGHIADGLTSIEVDYILCELFEVESLVEVNAFVAASNTSRAHTVVEKLMGDIHVGVASKAQTQLHKLVEELRSEARKYTLTTNTGVVINLADNDVTLVAVAKGLISNVAVVGKNGKKSNKFGFAATEQIQELAAWFMLFLNSVMTTVESNFARDGYKTAIKKYAAQPAPEPMYDEDGEILPNASYFDWFTNRVLSAVPAAKVKGKQSKVAEMEALVAQMAAEIERLRATKG